MTTEVKTMVNEYMAAWNAHDINKILSFFAEGCVFEDLALGVVSNGKKELAAFLPSRFVDIPNVRFDLKSVFGSGAWLGMEWVMSGTFAHSSIPGMPATRKTFSVRGAKIAQLRNGKITRETDYYNLATLLQQVGLMPAHPKQ